MTFVIYNKETTKLAYRAGRGISKETWNTESSAKCFLTRCEKGISKIKGGISILKDLKYPDDIILEAKNILNSL